MPETVDWVTFTKESPEFPKLYHKLFRAILQLVLDTTPAAEDVAGAVICELMMASTPDFDDILLLCSQDRHWGALKLLRILFERTVTLKYLVQNPAEAEAFLAFDALDWNAVLSGIEKWHGIQANQETQQRIQEAANRARERFKQAPCKECGMRKQISWTPRSSLELAQKTGLDHLHFEGFILPTKFIHPTYFGTHQVSGDKVAPLPNTLKATHVLTLETALAHQRYFKGDPLASPLVAEAVREFFSVWKYADTDFGLGEHAVRMGLRFVSPDQSNGP
jgi:hypothetical protein